MTDLGSTAMVGLLAALIVWVGWRQGFFQCSSNEGWNPAVRLVHVLVAFALYFVVSTIISPLYIALLKPLLNSSASPVGYISWVNFLLSATVLLALFLWWRSFPQNVRFGLIRNEERQSSWKEDLKFSLYAWIIAFPVVLFINQIFEALLFLFTGIQQLPDQLAVRFVKMTAAYPFYFSLAILSVVFIAPMVEEFLFRGLLQSFIRKHLGAKQAVIITALCFSLFHFSPEQGLGNISIVASLFPLALMLGFIYERQQSLRASIGLHALFNGMSILNLYFMGGIPCA